MDSKNLNNYDDNNHFKKPSRPTKKIIKPLAPEKKFENINDDELELSRVIFRIKRSAEVEPSEILEIDEMSAPHVYKKHQNKHIRECDEHDIVKKEKAKDDELENDNNKLVLKKFDPSFVFEDEKNLRKEYRLLYNDQNTKLKRENLLKQKRKDLLTRRSKEIEFLNMALGAHFEIKNPAEPPLIPLGLEQGFSFGKNQQQLKEELEKSDYAYYFLERRRNDEMQEEDVTKIRFDDLAKAVIENHLNKSREEEELHKSQEIKELLSASYQNSHVQQQDNHSVVVNPNKSHILNFNLEKDDPDIKDLLSASYQNMNFPDKNSVVNPSKSHILNFSREKDDDSNSLRQPYFYSSVNKEGLFKQKDDDDDENNDGQVPNDDDNFYAPNIEEKNIKKKRSQQKSRRIYKRKFWKVITKQKGSYRGHFVLQMLFLLGQLASLKIDHRQPELQLFVNLVIFGPLLVLGILMVIFGHISHQYISICGTWILFSIWLFSLLKSHFLLLFVGEILGVGLVYFVWKAKKWLPSSVEIFCGALAPILLSEHNLALAFIGGGLGHLLMKKKEKEKVNAVFSTTFIGLFLIEMSKNMIFKSHHQNDHLASVWVFILAIVRQAGCFICKKRKKRTVSSKSSVKQT